MNDRTPDESSGEQVSDYVLASLHAGLGYGPATNPKELFEAIRAAHQHTTSVTLDIPVALYQYFQFAAPRFGMSAEELIVRILETHRFTDQQQQHLPLALVQQQQEDSHAPT